MGAPAQGAFNWLQEGRLVALAILVMFAIGKKMGKHTFLVAAKEVAIAISCRT